MTISLKAIFPLLDLYKMISWEMGLAVERSRAALHRQIKSEVSRLCTDARIRPILVVDEAHHLRPDVLEDLRLLGWKGRGFWSSYSMYTPWHQEGGKGTRPKVVKFQVRPTPLAK